MIKNKNLSSEQKVVLFKEGTEPSGSSKLNHEKRIYYFGLVVAHGGPSR